MTNNFVLSSRVMSLLDKSDKTQGRKSWSDKKLLSRVLSAKTNKTYWNNIHELRGRASDSLYAQCMELIRSERPSECVAGITILSQFFRINKRKKYGVEYPYRKEVLRLFLGMLVSAVDSSVSVALLYGIGDNNPYIKPHEIDLLLPFISAREIIIRRAAVSALTGIPKMKAIRGLIVLSRDRYSDIRNWATFAIGTQIDVDNDEIRKSLYARCTDKHHDTRMEAIYGLAKRKDDGVKSYLEKEISGFTVYALESIQELHAVEYLPRLKSMLEETENAPTTNQYWLGHLKKCIESLGDSHHNT
jgi:hypothetical protein